MAFIVLVVVPYLSPSPMWGCKCIFTPLFNSLNQWNEVRTFISCSLLILTYMSLLHLAQLVGYCPLCGLCVFCLHPPRNPSGGCQTLWTLSLQRVLQTLSLGIILILDASGIQGGALFDLFDYSSLESQDLSFWEFCPVLCGSVFPVCLVGSGFCTVLSGR